MEMRELAKNAVQRLTKNGNGKSDRKEAVSAKAIEKEAFKLSKNPFFWVGVGCLGASAILRAYGFRTVGKFIGQCAAPILVMGLYTS